MKLKFLKKAIAFVFMLSCLLIVVCILSTVPAFRKPLAVFTNTTDYLENQSLHEILPAIEKVSLNPEKTKLIIGDSVCFRLFNNYAKENEAYCIAGTNRGIGLSGQYILAEIFLENHPNATDIYLVVTTHTMITQYETAYGYQYSVQPFLETDNLERLDEITLAQMQHAYGGFVTNKEAVRFVDNSPILKKAYFNLLNRYHAIYVLPEIPEMVEHYIVKMDGLCKENGVTLHLIPGPAADIPDRRIIDAAISESYVQTAAYELFPDYFDNLLYYPPSYFPDGVHPVLDSSGMCGLIHDLQEKNGCLEDFILPY